jgi:5,10-methylenetetrahydromethanopterin reductase
MEDARQTIEFGRLADDVGYDRIYVGDSQLIWREAHVLMTAIALNTSRAMVGAGVMNPLTRHATVIAGGLSTLDELAPGRIFFGAGLGDSSMYTMGKKPAPVRAMEQTIDIVKGLYAGEHVTLDGSDVHLGYAIPGRELEVLLAASGPRMLELTGRRANGAILGGGVSEEYLAYSQGHIRKGAEAGGRDLDRDKFKFVLWAPCSVSEDGQAARDAVRAHVARVVKLGLPFQLKPEEQAIVERLRAEYDYYEHMAVGTKHAQLVPDNLLERFAFVGTPAECREQVERVLALELPIDEIAIIPYAFEPTEKAAIIKTFAQQVMKGALSV